VVIVLSFIRTFRSGRIHYSNVGVAAFSASTRPPSARTGT